MGYSWLLFLQEHPSSSCQDLKIKERIISVKRINDTITFAVKAIMNISRSHRQYKGVFFDFSLTVNAAPHECVIRTGQP